MTTQPDRNMSPTITSLRPMPGLTVALMAALLGSDIRSAARRSIARANAARRLNRR